jgi:hypothetical protein
MPIDGNRVCFEPMLWMSRGSGAMIPERDTSAGTLVFLRPSVYVKVVRTVVNMLSLGDKCRWSCRSRAMLKNGAVAILLLTLFATTANSQSKNVPTESQQERVVMLQMLTNNSTSESPEQRSQREHNAHAFAERQTQLRLDTAKLVALTAELKEQVDKTGANILALDVIKKAQEIQKLAKSVQEKMKNAY